MPQDRIKISGVAFFVVGTIAALAWLLATDNTGKPSNQTSSPDAVTSAPESRLNIPPTPSDLLRQPISANQDQQSAVGQLNPAGIRSGSPLLEFSARVVTATGQPASGIPSALVFQTSSTGPHSQVFEVQYTNEEGLALFSPKAQELIEAFLNGIQTGVSQVVQLGVRIEIPSLEHSAGQIETRTASEFWLSPPMRPELPVVLSLEAAAWLRVIVDIPSSLQAQLAHEDALPLRIGWKCRDSKGKVVHRQFRDYYGATDHEFLVGPVALDWDITLTLDRQGVANSGSGIIASTRAEAPRLLEEPQEVSLIVNREYGLISGRLVTNDGPVSQSHFKAYLGECGSLAVPWAGLTTTLEGDWAMLAPIEFATSTLCIEARVDGVNFTTPITVDWPTQDGNLELGELRLQAPPPPRSLLVTGAVHDTDGVEIAGVEIEAHDVSGTSPARILGRTQTDALGAFKIFVDAYAPDSTITVHAHHTQFVPSRSQAIPPGSSNVILELKRAGKISAPILLDEWLTGENIIVRLQRPQILDRVLSWNEYTHRDNAEFSTLRPGPVSLIIELRESDWVAGQWPLNVELGEALAITPIDLRGRFRRTELVVKDSTGIPLPNYTFNIRGAPEDINISATTGQDGRMSVVTPDSILTIEGHSKCGAFSCSTSAGPEGAMALQEVVCTGP